MYIRVWRRGRMVFFDLVNGVNCFEVKRFNTEELKFPSPTISYHLSRLMGVTGVKSTNETDLCL